MSSERLVLGIDPGLVKTGWGVVASISNSIKYIDCGVIRTAASESMETRLVRIYDEVTRLISDFKPAAVAMEDVFINMNPKSSEKLIMARTAAFLAVAKAGFFIDHFKPNEIKKNVTGSGHAPKEQVHIMVQKILGATIPNDRKTHTLDSMDALAAAICRVFGRGGG
ncbi:MAG: crossover junction endodeoxyribonuclease RuvC [Alphaproteobacteria bacterium]|nr:crossover junction endodeoxyribonuclease RuvC [Alphaproteobacteria bacterium]